MVPACSLVIAEVSLYIVYSADTVIAKCAWFIVYLCDAL